MQHSFPTCMRVVRNTNLVAQWARAAQHARMWDYVSTGGDVAGDVRVLSFWLCAALSVMSVLSAWHKEWPWCALWCVLLALAWFYPVAGVALGLLAVCAAILVVGVFK